MAYTIEEVEKALLKSHEEWPMYYPQNPNPSESINYSIVTNYLTGKSNSPNGLQFEHKIASWYNVINLLTDLENISSNEQLVLDIIYDPTMYSILQFNFNHWLVLYFLKNDTDGAFQSVLKQFRKQGMNDAAIFNYLITKMNFGTNVIIDIDKIPFQKFLSDHIKKSNKIIYPSQGLLAWNVQWSWFYFRLLEEVNPEFAREYVLNIVSYRHNLIGLLREYRQGKYMPEIISFVSNNENDSFEMLQAKFDSAIQLYEIAPTEFVDLVLKLSMQYLEFWESSSIVNRWEYAFHLKEFENSDLKTLPYRACALHFLFKHVKEKALTITNDLLQRKAYITFESLSVIYHYLQNDAYPYFDVVIKNDVSVGGIEYYRSVIGFLLGHFQPDLYLSSIWSLINNKSKPVRELAANIIAENDPEAEKKSITLLENKSADIRQTAALILSHFSSAAAKNAVMKIINSETNDNARDILLGTIAESLPSDANKEFASNMVEAAKKRGKLNKPIESWLDEDQLPSLYFTTGELLSKDEIRFLLYRMCRAKAMRSDTEAKYMLRHIEKETATPFALELIKIFREKGGKPDNKYLMALSALLGNDDVVEKIKTSINNWIDENRLKMAEYGVGALALQGSDKALRWVEWYSRKYRSKKATVGAAARTALENAADELGISAHELGDRIVPDFGFNGLFKYFNINGEEFRAFVDSNFKIAFFNEENKKLKTIPASADAALKDEFKKIAKEVRDIVKSQSPRLEYYLVIQRKWTWSQWQQFFLHNPIMFIYATKLVWGIYSENGELLQTFICNDDTSLVNETQEEITIEDGIIGIVHPTQLSAERLQEWKQLLFDLSVEQIFPQLERRTVDLSEIDLSKTIIQKYVGKHMTTGSIRSTLERYGWHKGPTGDGGVLHSFNLLYMEKKLEAIMEVEGVGAGFGWGMDEKLGRLFIIDKTKSTTRWVYVTNESDERLVRPKDIPMIFLVEMLAAVEAIKQNPKKE